jgi:tRNA threonylcarbamoyladenosine biosynthesis protein TsaB
MNILALETSTEHLSLALLCGERAYARDLRAGQRHAELILGEIEALLARAGLQKQALDGIAFGEGPGSFTGLRIACGVAQGLALALDIPVVGIGTLLAVADSSEHARVVSCLDARMGEVYHAAYEKRDSQWHVVIAPGLHRPEAVPLPTGTGWAGCGSGFAAYGPVLTMRHGALLSSVSPDMLPTASAIARLALPLLQAGEGKDPAQAQPFYLRDKVALKTSER